MGAALDHNQGYMPFGSYPRGSRHRRRMKLAAFAGCDGHHLFTFLYPIRATTLPPARARPRGVRLVADAGISGQKARGMPTAATSARWPEPSHAGTIGSNSKLVIGPVCPGPL